MGNAIFVAGTGTDVGKTIITASILTKLSKEGVNCSVFKPVQSGATKKESLWISPDIEECSRFSGLEFDHNKHCTYFYEAAQGPSIAANYEGKKANIEKIMENYYILLNEYDFLLVEGAGGILSPMGEGLLPVDLIKKLELPVLLVASPDLGTINSTLLSVNELKRNDIKILGIVFSGSLGTDPYFDAVKKEVETFSGINKIYDVGFKELKDEKDRLAFWQDLPFTIDIDSGELQKC